MSLDQNIAPSPAPEVNNPLVEQNAALIKKVTTVYPHAFKELPGHPGVIYLDRPPSIKPPIIHIGDDQINVIDTVFLSPDKGMVALSRLFLESQDPKVKEIPGVITSAYDKYVDILNNGSLGRDSSIEACFERYGQEGFDNLKKLFSAVNVANEAKDSQAKPEFKIEF